MFDPINEWWTANFWMVVTDFTEPEIPYLVGHWGLEKGPPTQDWSETVYPYTYEMNQALNKDRLDRYRAEADSHRLAALARQARSDDLAQSDRPRKIHARRALLAGALTRMAEAISPSERSTGKAVTTD